MVGSGGGKASKSACCQFKSENNANCFFYDSLDIIHSEFLPPRQTVNETFYHDLIYRLLKCMQQVRKGQYESGEWNLLHDNAPAHSSIIVSKFLAKWRITVINQRPIPTPLLARSGTWGLDCFPKSKPHGKTFWISTRNPKQCDEICTKHFGRKFL